MKIAVGTVSDQKLGYLRDVLTDMSLEYDLFPIASPSGISEQPISSKETKLGSKNRANHALLQCTEADIAIGIEVGYHPNKTGDYKLLCWTTVVDKNGRELSTVSHGLLLPDFHQKVIKRGEDVGDYVNQYISENSDPLLLGLGEAIRNRKSFIDTALRLAIWEYVSR